MTARRTVDLTPDMFPVERPLPPPVRLSANPRVREALEWYGRMAVARDPQKKAECRRKMIKAVCRE